MCPSDLAKKTKLIIPNKEMDDIMKIVKSLGESILLIKVLAKQSKAKKKELKGGFSQHAALNAAEIKIPGASNLVKKTEYDTKISNIESKYFTSSDYN